MADEPTRHANYRAALVLAGAMLCGIASTLVPILDGDGLKPVRAVFVGGFTILFITATALAIKDRPR